MPQSVVGPARAANACFFLAVLQLCNCGSGPTRIRGGMRTLVLLVLAACGGSATTSNDDGAVAGADGGTPFSLSVQLQAEQGA